MGRASQTPIKDWRELASKIGDAIVQEIKERKQELVVYGHSFGGLLAYLTLVHIRKVAKIEPVVFLMGSKVSPKTFVQPDASTKLIHDFSPEEMKEYYMKNFAHGAPPGMLKIPGMVEMICRPLQVDLGMNQKFWWDLLSEEEKQPFSCPIHAFHGTKDDRVTKQQVESKEGWKPQI
jgi:surfactin synthase thioesterase subunit